MNWEQKLIEQLDKDKPDWWLAWASQSALMNVVSNRRTVEQLKTDLASQLFHPILHAALSAGIIYEWPPQQLQSKT